MFDQSFADNLNVGHNAAAIMRRIQSATLEAQPELVRALHTQSGLLHFHTFRTNLLEVKKLTTRIILISIHFSVILQALRA